MKTLLRQLLCLLMWLPLVATAQSLQQQQNRLRVMTYNVRNAIGMDGRCDVARVAALMRQNEADVVAVQEVDSATVRSGKRYVLGELAAEGLYYPVFAPAINYDGGKYGVGLLCREKPVSVKRVPLPGREEKRVLLIVEFGKYVMACTHLSLTEADRMASLDIIRAEAARCSKPFVLAGDLNDVPDSGIIKQLSRDFRILNNINHNTYPADKPDRCLDYIAVYKPTGDDIVNRGGRVVPEEKASDHRPVMAMLAFKMPADRLIYHSPYLQNPTSDGITVMFQTRAVAHSWVEYGTDTLQLKRVRALTGGQAVCHDIENKVRLDSLEGGKTYYYRVVVQEIVDYKSYSKAFGHTQKTPFRSFRLPEKTAEDFTAIILNDLHDHRQTVAALGRLAKCIPHDFVVFNGDCLSEPGSRAHAMQTLHRLADAFGGASKPLFFIRGNHEIRNAYSSGMPTLFDNPGGNTYGAFSWGDTRFVLLDCGEDKPDDHWAYSGLNDFTKFRLQQMDFLRSELKSKAFRKASRRILIHHIPLWGLEEDFNPCMELWGKLLENAPFDLDVTAHTHRYNYYAKGEVERNPFPVVVGGGPGVDKTTLLVLTKKGRKLTLRVLNGRGEELDALEL